MREKCLALLEHVRKRLALVAGLQPRIFVADHFASLRTEIDLETETRLIQLAEFAETKPEAKPRGSFSSTEEDWDEATFNSARQSMIDELKRQEAELLDALKQSDADFGAFQAGLQQLGERLEAAGAAVESGRSSDWRSLGRLTHIYLEIEQLHDAFKARVLERRTFVFKARFLNPLGALIIFQSLYLSEAEVQFIKNKHSSNKRTMVLKDILQYIDEARLDRSSVYTHQAGLNRVLNKSMLIVSSFNKFVASNRLLLANRTLVKIDESTLEQKDVAAEATSEAELLQYFGAVRDLELNGCQIGEIEPRAFEHLRCLASLSLSLNRIRSLNRAMFAGLVGLRNLTLVNNKIRTTESDCFDELAGLAVLGLNSNELESLRPRQFSSLRKLKNLSLSLNKICRLESESESSEGRGESQSPFYQMESLNELQMNSNRLTELAGFFDGLPSLRSLNLMSNRVEELSACLLNPTMTFTSLETLNLSFNSIRRIGPEVFRNLGNLQTLQLNNNRLVVVDDCLQHLYSLKKLVIKSNLIEQFSAAGPFRQLVNLMNLDLSWNRIRRLDEGLFESLGKLEWLNLSNNQIAVLRQGHFKGLSQLKNLNLSYNRIAFDDDESEETDVFQHLTALKDLNLGNNDIKRVWRSLFGPSLRQLETLGLSCNQIGEIDESAFQHLKKLQNFNVDFNRLRAISMQTFQGLDSLKTLYLTSNYLTSLQDFTFINLLNLEYLVIDSNLLESIGVNAFNCLFNLRHLNLSMNLLERLDDGLFQCMTKLNDLFLNGNLLSSIRADTFLGLENVLTLVLSQNNLESLDEDVFKHMPKIRQLMITNNQLRSVHVKSMRGLELLSHLDLSANQIEALDDEPGDYQTLTSLVIFYLNNNPIRYVRPDTFRYLVSLSQLNMFNAELQDLDEHLLDSFHSLNTFLINSNQLRRLNIATHNSRTHGQSQISMLNLNENRIRELRGGQFERVSLLSQLDLNSNRLVEIGRDALKGLAALRVLSLNSNRIRHVHPEAFRDATCISTLGLSGNSLRGLEPNTLIGLKNLSSFNLNSNLIARLSDVFRFVDFSYDPMYFSLAQAPEIDHVVDHEEFDDLDFGVHYDKNRWFQQFSFLDLSANYIRDLSDIDLIQRSTRNYNLFAHLSNVVLNRNFISRFEPEKDFVFFDRLIHLSLSFNDIERLACPQQVGDAADEAETTEEAVLKQVMFFNVDHNRIRYVEPGFFAFYLAGVKNLNLNGNEIETLDERVFRGLRFLNYLNLSKNKVRTLDSPRYFEDAVELLNIQMTHNQLETLHEDLFAKQTKLVNICFKFNQIRRLPTGLLRNALALKSLYLSNNLIEHIDDSAFANQRQMDILDLSSNRLRSFRFVACVPTLRNLNLSNNLIEDVDAASLAGFSLLTDLNLAGNKIKRIGGSVFSRLVKLSTLKLGENAIAEMDAEAFAGLSHLLNLDLSSNSLEEMKPSWFGGLKKLKSLNLRNNPFVRAAASVGSPFIADLGSISFLESLVLSNISLGGFFGVSFFVPRSEAGPSPFTSIKRIDLDQCDLEDLGEGAFSSLVGLEDLSMTKNKLRTLGNDAFRGLGRLKNLDLSEAFASGSFDQLVSEDKRPFDVLTDLNQLQLKGNHIEKLNGRVLVGMKRLTHLDLSENSLSSLDEHGNPLEGLIRLQSLNLCQNRLTGLSHSWLRGLKALKSLDLSINQLASLDTDSHDEELKCSPFFYNEELSDLSLSGNLLTQISAENLRSLTRLSQLDLSYNKIDSIGSLAFDVAGKSLLGLNLSNNELSRVGTRTFEKLERLGNLDLASNRVESFDVDHNQSVAEDELRLFENLKTLTLSRNKLRELDVRGMNLAQSRNLTVLYLDGNQFDDPEKLMRGLSAIRTLEVLDLAVNERLTRIQTSWMMLELNHFKYLRFEGALENDLAASDSAHAGTFFLNFYNAKRDLESDERFKEAIDSLRTVFANLNQANLYLTERALKSFSWKP